METGSQYRWKPTVLCPNLCVLGLPAFALWLLQDRLQTVRHQVERNMPGIRWWLCWLITSVPWKVTSVYISMMYWVHVWSTLLSTCCLLNIKSWPCFWWFCPQVDTGDLAQGLRLCLCCKNLFFIFERFLISSFLYTHLDRATQLEEYSRILCPTLGAPDNTWQPAQSVTKWVIWSNNLEINYK